MAGTTGALLSVLATFLVALGLFRYALATRRSSSLPPGPPTIPFFGGIQRPRSIVIGNLIIVTGNLHQMPATKGYLKFVSYPSLPHFPGTY